MAPLPARRTHGGTEQHPGSVRRRDGPPGDAEGAGAPWPGRTVPRRSGDTRGQPPPSYILFHQRPASLPSAPEKFFQVVPRSSPSRPRLQESSAVAPQGGRMHRRARSLEDPTGCARRSWEETQSEELAPLPALARSRACRHPPRQGSGEEGGSRGRRRRLEAGAGGGAGAGGRRSVVGRCALQERCLPAPWPPPGAPTPFPLGRHAEGGQRGPASGTLGTLGRMSAEEEGSVPAGTQEAELLVSGH